MPVVCADCSTENREAARFCKSCGAKLIAPQALSSAPAPVADTAWPVTAPTPLARAPELPPGLFDPSIPAPAPQMPARAALPPEEATVIVGAAARAQPLATPAKPPPALAPPPAPAQPAVTRKPQTHVSKLPAATPRSPGRGLRIGIAVLAVVVVGGGWYVLRDGNTAPVVAQAPPTAVAAAPTPAPASAPVIEPAAVAPAPAPEPPSPVAVTPTPTRTPTPTPAPAPVEAAAPARPSAVAATPKPRKVPVAAPSAAPAEPASTAAVVPPPPAPAPPVNPQTACAGRNFVALAQCMASQCIKAEFKGTPQCDAVRTQQRLEEEKRNPSLLN